MLSTVAAGEGLTVSFIPVYLTLVGAWIWLYLRCPRSSRPHGIRLYAYVLFGIYVAILVYFCFTPFVFSSSTASFSINIVPVRESYLMLKYGYLSTALYNLIGNVVMMIPFALLAPVVFTNMNRWWRVVGAAFVTSLCIESLQLIFAVRIFDVDDLILNTLGACVGCVFYRLITHRWPTMVSGVAAGTDSERTHCFTRNGSFPLTYAMIAGFAGFIGLVIGVAFAATLASI